MVRKPRVTRSPTMEGGKSTLSRFALAFKTCPSVQRKAASSSSVVLFDFQFKYSGTVRRPRLLDLAALLCVNSCQALGPRIRERFPEDGFGDIEDGGFVLGFTRSAVQSWDQRAWPDVRGSTPQRRQPRGE